MRLIPEDRDNELRGDYLRRVARLYAVWGTMCVAVGVLGHHFADPLLVMARAHWLSFLLFWVVGSAIIVGAITLPVVAAACFADSVLKPRLKSNSIIDWFCWCCAVAVAFAPGVLWLKTAVDGVTSGKVRESRYGSLIERVQEPTEFWLGIGFFIVAGISLSAVVACSFYRSMLRYREWRDGLEKEARATPSRPVAARSPD